MATPSPSTTRSYADIVKSYQPQAPEEVAKLHRPSYAEVHKRYSRPRLDSHHPAPAHPEANQDDGWTDVSSATSCSWPGTTGRSHGDEQGSNATVSPDAYNSLEDPWYDDPPDTRGEDALVAKINSTLRSRQRYYLLGPLGRNCPPHEDKPWHPYPRSCHHMKDRKAMMWWPVIAANKTRRAERYDLKDAATE